VTAGAALVELETGELAGCFGFGVAGNFAGHLEQAGEAADFAAVAAEPAAPKGIFPWYLPGDDGFLGTFPVSADRIRLPASAGALDLQIEPEAGVLCRIEYVGGRPARVVPQALGAFNDCSIRRPGAVHISEKKNWGHDSKGFARRLFAVSEIDGGGVTEGLRLACFLVRGGEVFEYGVDSALPGYSYYGDTLLDWIADRLREQREAPPLEDVGAQLAACGRPDRALIGIGATRYTKFGESNFLVAGDESVVVVYDAGSHSPGEIAAAVAAGEEPAAASVLRQRVEAAAQ
jgi:hypothetical protein